MAAVCAVDDTILYANNQKDMQETTDIYVDWLNFVKMEANIEKCIHIRSIPRELKTEGLEKQIERIQWEAKEKYKESAEEALEETGWEKLEEGTTRTQIINQIYMMKGKEKTEGNNKRNRKTERTRRLHKMVERRTRRGEEYTRKARTNSTDFQRRMDKHKKRMERVGNRKQN